MNPIRRSLRRVKGWADRFAFSFGGPVRSLGVRKLRTCGITVDITSPLISNQTVAGLLWRRYESPERRLIGRAIDGKYPIVELGGSIGFISCLLGQRFPTTPRTVVEPDARLVELLRQNLLINGVGGVDVKQMAIDYGGRERVQLINGADCSLSGRIAGVAAEGQGVATTRLGELVAGFERFALVSDIEGGEIDVMLREPEDVRSRCQQAVVEFHRATRDGHEWTPATAAHAFATAWRMTVVAQEGDVWAFTR